jgi:hypothetical protein
MGDARKRKNYYKDIAHTFSYMPGTSQTAYNFEVNIIWGY